MQRSTGAKHRQLCSTGISGDAIQAEIKRPMAARKSRLPGFPEGMTVMTANGGVPQGAAGAVPVMGFNATCGET